MKSTNLTGNRIYFRDNPWPEGHPLKRFTWTAENREGTLWFHFHLESENYYAEREIDDETEYESDWKAPIVWGNYHSCTLSSIDSRGFPVCPVSEFSDEYLHGREFEIDNEPDLISGEREDLAFRIYLLGHDAAAKHRIQFSRNPDSTFDIEWTGKIALAYIADYEFKYDFFASVKGVHAPVITL